MFRVVLLAGCCVAAAWGAPAPDRAPWGEAVGGLRARLLALRQQVRVGEPLRLTLEVVNTSRDAVRLESPELMPLISYPGSHPYGGKRPFPWAITCESPNRKVHICWAQQAVTRRAREVVRLAPGEVYRVEAVTVPRNAREEKGRPRKAGEVQTERVRFVGADEPGTYLLRATFAACDGARGDVRAGVWAGKELSTPAVRVEIIP